MRRSAGRGGVLGGRGRAFRRLSRQPLLRWRRLGKRDRQRSRPERRYAVARGARTRGRRGEEARDDRAVRVRRLSRSAYRAGRHAGRGPTPSRRRHGHRWHPAVSNCLHRRSQPRRHDAYGSAQRCGTRPDPTFRGDRGPLSANCGGPQRLDDRRDSARAGPAQHRAGARRDAVPDPGPRGPAIGALRGRPESPGCGGRRRRPLHGHRCKRPGRSAPSRCRNRFRTP